MRGDRSTAWIRTRLIDVNRRSTEEESMATVNGHDFVILHRGTCACASDGYVADVCFLLDACQTCGDGFEFSVPIRTIDGWLIEHLSCAIARGIYQNEVRS